MSRPKIRFGLRHLILLVSVVGLGLAYYVRPSFYASAKMDFCIASASPRPGQTTPLEDHRIRIGSPRIIDEALSKYPKLREYIAAENKILWVYERLEAVPDDSGVVEIRIFSEATEKEQLELLAKGISESYHDWLTNGNAPPNLRPTSTDFDLKSGWGRARRR